MSGEEFSVRIEDDKSIRELTYDERATWGTCPVCAAEHGKFCNSSIGIPLGRNVNGDIPERGVHLVRLQNAPFRVKTVAYR